MPVRDYTRTITGKNSWGGAIELAIFATYFQTEIVSIDVETLRPYHFGKAALSHDHNARQISDGG